ncbi:hypothetical protein PBI_ASERPROCKY_7 [Gordonia phage ASerpRocky]|uniref:Uncharacterized protein n=1 Tax=Gordonia phage ASerpRocky TaxID=2599841 RepID=A0A5J6TC59_9CAUD|nr:hypothetical protein PBI_ASERPROCKY_7 [Gordonia phage ASerpRocky]
MSERITDDELMRARAGLVVQPLPEPNDLPSAHDLVTYDLRNQLLADGLQKEVSVELQLIYMESMVAFARLCTRLGRNPREVIAARKSFGMEKYGTPLQPFNGRDQLEDSLDEKADDLVYLRMAIYEEEHGGE